MIAEVLLVLAGHTSSLFTTAGDVQPGVRALLHPGEEESLRQLGEIARRYRSIRAHVARLARPRSRYVAALCAALSQILSDDYESLVVATEASILRRDPDLVAHRHAVPLAAVRAAFAEWDAPLAALDALLAPLDPEHHPGPLIDMLLARANTGVHRVARIMSALALAVQRTWRAQLAAFLVHGALSPVDPLASDAYVLLDGAMPSCVSHQSRDSIVYVGRAIATVKKKCEGQIPRELALQHAHLLDTVLPEDQYRFDLVIAHIRTNVSDWLWLNILTRKHVEDAVLSLANYFLLRDGEFGLALIRDIEQLKLSRLTTRPGGTSMIKEQDLNLALLRASLGTTAQHDPSLLHLKFHMPSGPIRPLLPSLGNKVFSSSTSNLGETPSFDDLLLGTPLVLTYHVAWPLDLFLHPPDLQIYAALFNYLSSLRKTHARIHACWASLSNAQRARRRWTGLGEGGTTEDLDVRKQLLRCGWGVVRDMGWMLDCLLGYVMVDVVDVEFRRFRDLLNDPRRARSEAKQSENADALDFTTLRNLHTTYLERLVAGCLLSHSTLAAIIRSIFEVCEHFVAQVERWGGDVLPALLFEGSISADDKVGAMVQERLQVVSEINKSLHTLLDTFYDQLSLSTSQQPFAAGELSKSVLTGSTTMQRRGRGSEEVRRHVERLLLRLDLNGPFWRRGVE